MSGIEEYIHADTGWRLELDRERMLYRGFDTEGKPLFDWFEIEKYVVEEAVRSKFWVSSMHEGLRVSEGL